MVDQKSETYRPRRALIEPDVEPAPPKRPGQSGRNGNGRGHLRPEPGPLRPEPGPKRPPETGTRRPDSGSMRPEPGPLRPEPRPLRPEPFDELRTPPVDRRASTNSARKPPWSYTGGDQPKPLYRDGGLSRRAAAPRMPADPPTQETLMTPAALAPRRPPSLDDETTTILPRSRPTKHRTQALDAVDDFDDERGTLSQRTKLALLIGAVAAVVVIGLFIGYAVRSADDQPQSKPNNSPPAGNGTAGGNPAPGQTAVLSDASMLNPDQAKALDPDRSWKVVTTQQGPTEESPTAACFGGEPLEGHQTPQQEIIRVLGSGGKNAPKALHIATSYNSPEEAGQAYMIASKTLGGCAVPGFYIESGHYVSGIGDQALGLVVVEVDGKDEQAHSVVLSRTGRVVNVLDAAQPSRAIAVDAVTKAMSQVNGTICAAAGGPCDGNVSVKDGPPPPGGDDPSFLTSGDLPPAGPKEYLWVATPVVEPEQDFKGSQCERMNWATVPAKSRSTRVYLMQESAKDSFGLDEIVLTMKNAKEARAQVETIKSNLSRCEARMPTASVPKPKKVTSIGAKKTEISGWTAEVSQKSTKGTAKYRVGIVSAGPKVIYTFANPRGDYDFTDRQWDTIAVRAGERITLV